MNDNDVKGKVLRARLERFSDEMFKKFLAVEYKHRKNSVTDDATDWFTFDWDAIEEHFWEEVSEVNDTLKNPHASDEIRAKELVDVANMAFLLWWAKSMATLGQAVSPWGEYKR